MRRKQVLFLFMLATFVVTQVRAEDTKQDMIRKVECGLSGEIRIGTQTSLNLEERMKSLKIPGLSIAVVKDFQVHWAKSYGVRDSRTASPITDATLFQAASITKSIGAVVALRLVQDGILDLDKEVNAYLKRWKVPENEFTRVEKVTLRRLLSHTGGLTVPGFRGYAEGEDVPTILQVLDGLPPANNDPVRVDRVPGSEIRYSGGGYTVLQVLLEDVTGRPLAELAKQYVFEPAGMTHSTLCPACEESSSKETAMGHSVDDAGDIASFKGYAFLQGGSGCCELWTTSIDLAHFVIAMQRSLRGDPGAMLSRETARAMITPQRNVLKGPGVFDKGLGFDLPRYGDAMYFNHDGGNIGFSARYIGHPERGYGYAVMANSDRTSSLATELTIAVADAYGWEGIKSVYYRDAAALIEEIRLKLKAAPDDPDISENGLNGLGYYLLSRGYHDAALDVLMLNLECHPRSANCRDSAAEAYERIGDTVSALKYYRRAIDLLNRFPEENKGYEPVRAAATEKIRRLEGKTEH